MPDPKSTAAELKRLQDQIELEKARIELANLKKHKGKPIEKTLRQRAKDFFLGAGGFATIFGGGLVYVQSENGNDIELTQIICDNAHKAAQDEKTNPAMTAEQNSKYVSDQLKIIRWCDMRFK